LRKLRLRDDLSEAEERVLRASASHENEVPAGRTIIKAGIPLNQCTLLVEGMVARYKDLADGQRQIMELHVAGDFLDLHSFPLKQLEHDVGTLTPSRLVFVPHDALKRITEDQPHLTRLLWFSTLLDAAIQRERILSVGRRTAIARIAHLMCELYIRLDVVGLAGDMRFQLPITQIDLADTCGLTSVHVNRMLKQLRNEGLMTFRGGEVLIHDWEKLQDVAEFSPAFLHLDRQPR
jgi:CRP-like cAMP-binding protein